MEYKGIGKEGGGVKTGEKGGGKDKSKSKDNVITHKGASKGPKGEKNEVKM